MSLSQELNMCLVLFGGPGPNLKWMSLQNKFSLSWYFSFFSKDGTVMNKCVYVMIFMHVHYAFQKKRKRKIYLFT
jgi:hypothetical protein